MSDTALEAAARAICRRRLLVGQERARLTILTDAHLQESVDTTWYEYADDARVALKAALTTRHEDPKGAT